MPAASLEARIARLERQNRRLRRLVAAALLGAAALFLMGQSVERIVRAQRFEVVDEQNHLRAIFGHDADGRVVLAFANEDGSWELRGAELPAPAAASPESDAQREERYEREASQAERAVDQLGRDLSDTLDRANQAIDNRFRNRD